MQHFGWSIDCCLCASIMGYWPKEARINTLAWRSTETPSSSAQACEKISGHPTPLATCYCYCSTYDGEVWKVWRSVASFFFLLFKPLFLIDIQHFVYLGCTLRSYEGWKPAKGLHLNVKQKLKQSFSLQCHTSSNLGLISRPVATLTELHVVSSVNMPSSRYSSVLPQSEYVTLCHKIARSMWLCVGDTACPVVADVPWKISSTLFPAPPGIDSGSTVTLQNTVSLRIMCKLTLSCQHWLPWA